RKMKDGTVLGEEQRIPVLAAIEAVTKNAAYQYFEEDIKGTIKENKLADLVILDKNPLKVDVDDIRNIKVVETFKEGNSIYKA
ncbi:MAG: amidohydrolase family protein, partial [Serratia marcescens]|nr:amidohydrolase family protein [Serratia marcescens]